MEKLEPIIRNRFWILAFLVLPMAMYGFYSANGALKEKTEARISELKGINVSNGFEPNEHYTKNLAAINDRYEQLINQEIVKLWNHQKQRMVWPTIVANKVPEEFMGEFDLDTLFTYKGEYKNVMEDLVHYAEPVMPRTQSGMGAGGPMGRPIGNKEPVYAWKQKVILATTLPAAQFGALAITSQEMWDAQIDIWMTRLLLDAVRNINRDKDSVTEAVVRRIDQLYLFGGDGQPVLVGSGGGGGDSGGYGDEGMMGTGMDGGGGGGAAGSKIASSVSFSPAQEFGAGGLPTGNTGGGGGGEMYSAEGSGGYESGGGDGGPKEVLRYISESEEAPYLERGFYMSVIILQERMPDFLVELANSDWPIRVVRFQVGMNPYRQENRLMGMQNMLSGEGAYESAGGGYGASGGSPFGGGSMGGAMEGGLGGPKSAFGGLANGLPEFAQAALNHPDLIQLDLCGVITMYKQPTELLGINSEESEGSDGTSAPNETTSDPTAGDTTPTNAVDPNAATNEAAPAEVQPTAEPAATNETTPDSATTEPAPGNAPAGTKTTDDALPFDVP